MPRDVRIRLQDMLDAAARIAGYVDGMSFERFASDRRTVDAVVRNLEVIGEAARAVDERFRSEMRAVPFAEMAGMRDVLIHGYHRVDDELVWDAAVRVLPAAAAEIRRYLDRIG